MYLDPLDLISVLWELKRPPRESLGLHLHLIRNPKVTKDLPKILC